jgi:hypothetical protein
VKGSITLGELSDTVVSLAWKKIAKRGIKWFLIFELSQFLIGAGVVTYVAVLYPDQLVEFTQRMTGQ